MEDVNIENIQWYQSTQAPQVSLTLKAIAMLLIPVVKELFNIQIGTETVNAIIDAMLILGFGAVAAYGHLRAKKTLGAQIKKLKGIN